MPKITDVIRDDDKTATDDGSTYLAKLVGRAFRHQDDESTADETSADVVDGEDPRARVMQYDALMSRGRRAEAERLRDGDVTTSHVSAREVALEYDRLRSAGKHAEAQRLMESAIASKSQALRNVGRELLERGQ